MGATHSAPERVPRNLSYEVGQLTNLLSTVTLGAVAVEDPGISPDAEGSKVSANELEPVMPPQATICPVIEGEFA